MKEILIVWDIDGTLINSRGCGREAMEKAFHTMFGVENGFTDIKMAGRLDAMIVKDAFQKNNIIDADISLFFDTYCNILTDLLKVETYIEVLPGVKKILEYGSENYNFFHALGTGNLEKGARIKLESHDLNKYFQTGGFGDEALERWNIIHKAVENAQEFKGITYDYDNIYVIGDTPLDIECGKILGIKSIAVCTGAHGAEELIKHRPDYMFENLGNIVRFLSIFK
ncbi:HAD family hydrolase [Marinisporobacter balticus]|uniref:Phosphoglycolate phosphatase-like HAD superfamily hydrolase n=1 Tax=Marinisporobacter balticus TaxID=2018667 RepID=A0A4R2KF18_9FIRM|nr:HAD hydrolase-like protein [Marinisporobacter balticus]TCO72261.1 phosphoglycolate phosphatase-like HAD superfamily hydrolase [Marinisporobacter balticus]